MRIRRIALPAALGVTAIAALQPYRLVFVTGPSMQPAYDSGTFLVATPKVDDIKRGDVVVVDHDGTRYVKRVAFLAGDTYPEFWVGLQWTPAASAMALSCAERHHFLRRQITVPPGTVYVVGDNLSESIDSRSFGPIPRREVVLKVVERNKRVETPYFAGARFAQPTYVAARD